MTDSTADSPVDPTAVSTAVSTADPTAGPAQPSQTALRAAAARAAHLIVDDEPALHRDTLAYALLGERAEELVGYHRAHGDHLVLRTARTAATTRSRFTEDRLAEAVRRGTTQYVLLGAGLDSFAYRCEPAGPLRVFEVDHPASQAAKRRCLAAAGVTEPPHVAFVPADFETASPLQRLADAGFDPGRPALVSWLGVTMYLSRTAIAAVLAEVGGLAPGTELVGDYFLPEDLRDATGQAYAEAVVLLGELLQLGVELVGLAAERVDAGGRLRLGRARRRRGRHAGGEKDAGGDEVRHAVLPMMRFRGSRRLHSGAPYFSWAAYRVS